MPLIPTSTDQTDRDFTSLRLRMRNLLRSVFPEWTDFNVANFGNILTELFAYTGDVLGFYQDSQARQSRITTATQRRALLGLVKLVGFVPSTATAATVDQTFRLEAPPLGDVFIPRGTVIRTIDVTSPTRFETLEDATIFEGQVPPEVIVSASNSEERVESFASNGLPSQVFPLSSTPFIDATLTVIATDGSYSQVASFLDSSAVDRHYVVAVDQNDAATVTFGDGVSGAIPQGVLDMAYRTGGGSAGRIEANKLRVLERTTWADEYGNAVALTTTNAAKSSGGTDRQTVQQIQQLAPLTNRVQKRTIATEDYEINALRLPAVARALFLTSNEDRGVGENRGELYVVPVDGGQPSEALKSEVLTMVTRTYPNSSTFAVRVFGAAYRPIDVFAVVYFRGQTDAMRAATAASIRARLADFFKPQNADGTDNPNVDFGGHIRNADGVVTSEVALTDVENVVRDTPGVRKLGAGAADFTINDERADVILALREFPTLGKVEIRDGDSGRSL